MTDIVALWGVTRDAQLSTIDFGDVPARTSEEITFRVKNRSGVYTAMGVYVSAETGDSEDIYLSTDGRVFAARVDLGPLLPGAVSPPIIMRRTTAATAAPGAKTCNVRAGATGWTDPASA